MKKFLSIFLTLCLMLTIAAVPLPTIAETSNATVFDFENYSPNRYIGMSGRVAPLEEASGNTVIMFNNNGIPYRSSDVDKSWSYTKSGSTYTKAASADIDAALAADPNAYSNYYHTSAQSTDFNSTATTYNSMEAYNAIELGKLEAGTSYRITVNYKRESLANALYVQPVSWDYNANWRNTMCPYNEARITIPATDTADSDYVTVSTVFTTPADLVDPSKNDDVNGNILRLILFTGVKDANNVVYFDNITVEEIEGVAQLTYNYINGSKSTVPVEVGSEINYAALIANRNGDTVWSASKDSYVAPQKVMPNGEYNVYEYYQEGFFGFENYYRNSYIELSGRVQPIKLEDGNTVIKFDNNGIALTEKPSVFGTDANFYTKSYVNGEAKYTQYNKETDVFESGKYYHASATLKANDTTTNMDTYNAIELGKIEEGYAYKITINYKRENVVTPVTVSPRSWHLTAAWDRQYQTIYSSANFTIPVTNTPDSDWQTETVYISADTSHESTNRVLDQLRLVVYTVDRVDVNNVIYFDNITVEKIDTPHIIFNGKNGEKSVFVTGNEGDDIVAPTVTNGSSKFLGWFTDKECTVPFELDKFAADTALTVYAGWLPVYDFENYNPNRYIGMSGRVVPVEETDGNTVIMFNNNGIPYRSSDIDKNWSYTKSGSTYKKATPTDIEAALAADPNAYSNYYHASATMKANDSTTNMDTYNAIELGKIEEGYAYKITINYKREKVVSPVTVSPRSWQTNANSNRNSQIIYSSKIIIPETSTPDTEWQTATTYISAETTNGEIKNLDVLRLVIYTPDEVDVDNVVYFDNISVEKIEAPYILFDGQNGETPIFVKGEEGDDVVVPTVTNNSDIFLGWFTDKEGTVPFELDKFAADTAMTVYADWIPVYDFENYKPNQYIAISGRVQPVKEASGNTVIKFDNKGIPFAEEPFFWNRETNIYTKKYVDGKAVYTKLENVENTQFESGKYYHASATIASANITTGMDTYNAIELGNIKEGTVYKITINYKRQNVVTPVTVSPRSWKTNANGNRNSQIIYSSKITIPATSTPDKEWQTASTYISAKTTNGEIKDLNKLRLVIYALNKVDENNVIYFDNIVVEEIKAPYVFFEGQNGEDAALVQGRAGEEIAAPKPTLLGYSFNGWFIDEECTTRFTQKTFETDTAITVYADWNVNKVRKYSFEKYTIPVVESGFYLRLDAELVATKDAYDGNNVIEIDRTVDGEYNPSMSIAAVADGDKLCELNPESNYIVTVSVKIIDKANKSANVGIKLFTASERNHQTNRSSFIEGAYNINHRDYSAPTNWYTGTFFIDGASMPENGNYLYLVVQGSTSKVWADYITVTEIDSKQSVVVVDSGGSKNITSYVLTGKEGESFANRLPKNPVLSGKQFIGYYTKDSQGYYNPLAEADMKFDASGYIVYARFVDKKIYQNFENDDGYLDYVEGFTLTGPLNYDYEIYDSKAEGNSKDNVTSGRYSLHRKGNSLYIENACVLPVGNSIAEGQRYTVTMKIKLGKHKQTNGAVKVVSGRSPSVSWDTTGDYYSIAPIKDLKEGEWVEVSYTFNAVEPFVSIQTPGYVELFIDDIVFTLVDENTPLSEEPAYTDYVQVLLDENGNVITEEGNGIDISSIIDASLTVGGNGAPSITTIILISAIGGGVVLLLIALAVVLILVKRKKKKAKV